MYVRLKRTQADQSVTSWKVETKAWKIFYNQEKKLLNRHGYRTSKLLIFTEGATEAKFNQCVTGPVQGHPNRVTLAPENQTSVNGTECKFSSSKKLAFKAFSQP